MPNSTQVEVRQSYFDTFRFGTRSLTYDQIKDLLATEEKRLGFADMLIAALTFVNWQLSATKILQATIIEKARAQGASMAAKWMTDYDILLDIAKRFLDYHPIDIKTLKLPTGAFGYYGSSSVDTSGFEKLDIKQQLQFAFKYPHLFKLTPVKTEIGKFIKDNEAEAAQFGFKISKGERFSFRPVYKEPPVMNDVARIPEDLDPDKLETDYLGT